jgi:ubiquinone/menaquinone biosynthesis C-methylase UbiE
VKRTVIKKNWYDGWFYKMFIDPQHSQLRNRIYHFIEPDKRIIDIGCGTGGFTLKLAEKSNYVLGVDISAKMIETAQKRKMRQDMKNVDFTQLNALQLTKFVKGKFDYTTIAFILHEIADSERVLLLKELRKVAKMIVIYDYHIPLSFHPVSVFIRFIEFGAGREHFQNFRNYSKAGGLDPLLKEANLKIKHSKINGTGTFRIVAAL